MPWQVVMWSERPKPRLRKLSAIQWRCFGAGVDATGFTAPQAYDNWYQAMRGALS